MSGLKNVKLPPPKSESDFEELCVALWKRKLDDEHLQLVGRRGQGQDGVDLIGRKTQRQWVGIQCKVRTTRPLTQQEVKKDVQAAKGFNPRLSQLVFATTSPRDKTLQEYARVLTDQNQKAGLFTVSIFAWNDFERELSQESNLDICRRFYHEYFVSYENFGIAISRVLRISIGVGETADSQYEIMVGKTPSSRKKKGFSGLKYWAGTYFIVNLADKGFETFPRPTYDSDLEHAFNNSRDRHIIAKWLNSVDSIDELIYGDKRSHTMLITEKDYLKYRKSLSH